MTDDALRWALIDTLRLLNSLPFQPANHDEIERIAGTLGISVAASRKLPSEQRPTLKLASKNG